MTTPAPQSAVPLPRRLWRNASRIVRAASVAYSILFLLYLTARVTVGERWSVVAFANNLLPWLCWTGMALAAVGLLFRERRLLVALHIPAILVFGLTYGDRYLPKAPPPRTDGPVLTAVMYNVCG